LPPCPFFSNLNNPDLEGVIYLDIADIEDIKKVGT